MSNLNQNESPTTLKILRPENTSSSPSLLQEEEKNFPETVDDPNPVVEPTQTQPSLQTSQTSKILPEHNTVNAAHVDALLKAKEEELREEFKRTLAEETTYLREKFDFILHNEQVRASFMLREAHRERQEKIQALQTQLECKNFAGVAFVMCAERRKAKLEKLRLLEEYTGYINALKEILSDGQQCILHLSRGYKTAARVDDEWRTKMKKVIKEFQKFVFHFCGGTNDSNQYLFDIPALLKTRAPIKDDPEEDPCENYEPVYEAGEVEPPKDWLQTLEDDKNRPFVLFGDLADLKPEQRRQVVRRVKAHKTAPKKWKEYMFHDMFIKGGCKNLETIKYEIEKFMPIKGQYECPGNAYHLTNIDVHTESNTKLNSSRRLTDTGLDTPGNMGSILKVVTTSNSIYRRSTATKEHLLGARDSMEIASNTKLFDANLMAVRNIGRVDAQNTIQGIRQYQLQKKEKSHHSHTVKIDIQNERRESGVSGSSGESAFGSKDNISIRAVGTNEEDDFNGSNVIGSMQQDSFVVHNKHNPDHDNTISYEKICPMDKCKKMHVDSFTKTLPPYMKANPFTHIEQTFDGYEALSPEQLAILITRMEEKKERDRLKLVLQEEPSLDEWSSSETGIGVQTSELSLALPPCTCIAPGPTPCSSVGQIIDMKDFFEIKQKINTIKSNCFFDNRIDFDRFEVVGQKKESEGLRHQEKRDGAQSRFHDITNILKDHPSLCEIFQGNTS